MSKDPAERTHQKECVNFLTTQRSTPSTLHAGLRLLRLGYEELPDAKITFSRGSSYVTKFHKNDIIHSRESERPADIQPEAGALVAR